MFLFLHPLYKFEYNEQKRKCRKCYENVKYQKTGIHLSLRKVFFSKFRIYIHCLIQKIAENIYVRRKPLKSVVECVFVSNNTVLHTKHLMDHFFNSLFIAPQQKAFFLSQLNTPSASVVIACISTLVILISNQIPAVLFLCQF